MSRSTSQNAFETTLTAQFGPSDLVADVVSKGALASPCYLTIEPDDDLQREVIWFNGVFGATSFITTGTENRYLEGSAQGSNLTHPFGSKVRSTPVSQQFVELHNRIEGLSHSDLADLVTGDDHTQYVLDAEHTVGAHELMSIDHGSLSGREDNDHPQYMLDANHTKALHDALEIDAGTLDGINSTGFATSTHDHPGAVAGGADGFMTGTDKATLDDLVNTGGETNQEITTGAGLDGADGGSSGDVTLSHEDTSSQTNIDKSGVAGGAIDQLVFDGFGHVTGATSKTITPANIGAALTVHTHSYLPVNNPNMTGALSDSGVKVLDVDAGFMKLYNGTGKDVAWGDGVDELYLGGVQFAAGAYAMECDENGAMRRMKYTTKASARRFKEDIQEADVDPDEMMKWVPQSFVYKRDPEGKVRLWFIAEDIHESSGDGYVLRDEHGEIINTDDRAMIATLIAKVQSQHDQLEALTARLDALENA